MSATRNIHQLGDGDAIFLAIESDTAPSHIGGLTVIDGRDNPAFGFEALVARIEERIKLVPRFTWKIQHVPFGADRPYFVEDERFDARAHVNRVAVPGRGTMRDLTDLAGLLHARPLDRARPLWEAWWIEGLEDGRVAMLLKMHHCLLDGQAGIGLAEILMDLAPDADAPIIPTAMCEPSPEAPDLVEVTRRAALNAAVRPRKLLGHALQVAREAADRLVSNPRAPRTPGLGDVPRVHFNDVIGPRRAFAFSSVSLEAVREVKKHFDVTVNDVLLELVGSTLRRNLREGGQLPAESLVACCPVSNRSAGDKSLDNQLATMPISMATHLADPAKRLREIHRNTSHAKGEVTSGRFDVLTAVGEVLAPMAVEWVVKGGAKMLDRVPLPANLVFSNVRGLPVPVYMAGGRVDAMYPMSLLQLGNGLNVTAVSYMDRIDFGFLVDPDLVRDPWKLAEGIPAALEALQTAAAGVVHEAR